MEAAGIVLAVMPLIISAYKNYEVAFQPFVIFLHSQKNASRFQCRLKIQQVAFENECLLLLSAVTRQHEEMVSNPAHDLWRDKDLLRKLSQYLSDSSSACVLTLRLIHDTLEEIDKDSGGSFVDLQKPKEESRRKKNYRLRQKIKLGFSMPRLDEKIEILRKYNGDLRVISKQLKRLATEQIALPASKDAEMTTEKYQVVRQLSQTLHDILSSALSGGTCLEHSGNIYVDEDAQNGTRVVPSRVCFRMAITCIKNQGSAPPVKPLRLAIESTFEQEKGPTDLSVQPEEPGYLKLTTALEVALDKQRKQGNFGPPHSTNAAVIAHVSSHPTSLKETPTDLYSVQDTCAYIQECLKKSSKTSQCIGYWQETKTCKHSLHLPEKSQQFLSRSMSLEGALIAAKRTRLGISLPDRIRLGTHLALAVLQLHSTSWLRNDLRSHNIYVSSSEDESRMSLEVPYLRARLVKDPESGSQALSMPPPAPNGILYGLGVILIELGFEAPIEDMYSPEDGQSDQYTTYRTAQRLSRSASSKMGNRYGKLVRRCLNCDFGTGGPYELKESAELRNKVYQHVVCELRECLNAVLIC